MWVFSGDVDGIVPVLGSRRWVAVLGLPTVKPWRPWYSSSGQVRQGISRLLQFWRCAGSDGSLLVNVVARQCLSTVACALKAGSTLRLS